MKKANDLQKVLQVTKNNIYQGLRLCQEKGVKLYVQKCERSLDDEFIVCTDTWANNPNPTIGTFLSDISDEDFLAKLDKVIRLFFEHIKLKKKGGGK